MKSQDVCAFSANEPGFVLYLTHSLPPCTDFSKSEAEMHNTSLTDSFTRHIKRSQAKAHKMDENKTV